MNFLKRSAILNIFFLFEAIISFLVDITVAAFFGISVQTDALYAAWLLPQAIGRGIFQSLTTSFMGIFAEEELAAATLVNNQQAVDEQQAVARHQVIIDGHQISQNSAVHVVYSQAITVIFALVLPLTLFFSLGSGWWLPLTIPGADQATQTTAIPLAQVLSWLIGFLAIAETCRAIYYREDQMWWPSLSRIISGLVAIGVVGVAGLQQSLSIAAAGVLVGAALEAFLTFIGLRYVLDLRIAPRWPSRAKLRKMVSVVGLPISGLLIRTFSAVVERALASLLGPGAITLVSYVNRIIGITERFVFRGFVISIIREAEEANAVQMRAYLRIMLFIALPITVAFATLAEPIVSILFAYGNFTAENVGDLALLLRWYSLAIFGIALTRIPLGKAYASTRPGIIFVFFLVVSIVLIVVEAALIFAGVGLPAFGIAYTVAIAACFAWMAYAILLPQGVVLWRWPDDPLLVLTFIVTGLGTALWVWLLENQLPTDAWWRMWALIIIGMIGSLFIFGGTALIVRLSEAMTLWKSGRKLFNL